MKTTSANSKLINAIRKKIPHGETLVKYLSDLLFLGKEAIYRRLRGEVPFTLTEAEIISHKMHISLDDTLSTYSSKGRPCLLKFTDYSNPEGEDLFMLNEFIDFFKTMSEYPESELASVNNILPQTLYMRSNPISTFFLFKWLYQYEGTDFSRSYNDIIIPDNLMKLQKQYIKEAHNIKHTFYIIDNLIFFYLINDIKYFSNINLIEKEDVQILKEELLNFINYLEVLCEKGKYENGNSIHIYVSNTNFDSNYCYLQSRNQNICLIRTLTLNSIVSSDQIIFDKFKKWIHSLKRTSTLISESGEAQRIQFFKEQRQLINTL